MTVKNSSIKQIFYYVKWLCSYLSNSISYFIVKNELEVTINILEETRHSIKTDYESKYKNKVPAEAFNNDFLIAALN